VELRVVRRALLVWLLAAFGLAGCCANKAPGANGAAAPTTSLEENCGPELSQEQLLEIVRAAVRVSGGDPLALTTKNYSLSTSRHGCDYLVSAVSWTTTNHFSLLISRSGEIKTWPWCCEASFFVPPLKVTKPSKESPPPPRMF
jgi:hypothetical protein